MQFIQRCGGSGGGRDLKEDTKLLSDRQDNNSAIN